jgi:DNA polymerase-3 subunit beta
MILIIEFVLIKTIASLGSVINSNNTLPILDNFLFELDHNELTVSASDLETMSIHLAIDSTSWEALPYLQSYF